MGKKIVNVGLFHCHVWLPSSRILKIAAESCNLNVTRMMVIFGAISLPKRASLINRWHWSTTGSLIPTSQLWCLNPWWVVSFCLKLSYIKGWSVEMMRIFLGWIKTTKYCRMILLASISVCKVASVLTRSSNRWQIWAAVFILFDGTQYALVI